MTGEIAIPLLPCRSIDEVEDFYRMLGFERTYRQTKLYPCVGLRRDDLQLQFFGLDGFDPETSYGSCVVLVEDPKALYEAFAAGMRAVHGKVLVSGLPRMTRPRKRKNVGNTTGFSVVDPGGNWIRFFHNTDAAGDATDPPSSKLANSLRNAVVLGDSKGDLRQAARILDTALTKHRESAPATDLVEALVYGAELAIRLGDQKRARALLTEAAAAELTTEQRESLSEALANAAELEQATRKPLLARESTGGAGGA